MAKKLETETPKENIAIPKLALRELVKIANAKSIPIDVYLDLIILNNGDVEKTNNNLKEIQSLSVSSNLPYSTIVKYLKYKRV